MKKINILLAIVCLALFFIACDKKAPEMSDLDKLRNSTNEISYPAVQMDSIQAINSITKQKVQELLELSTLYMGGNRKTQIDQAIYKQLQEYFYQPDSLTFKPLFSELDSLKPKTAKVSQLEVLQNINGSDTVDIAKFNVEYFDKNNKSIGKFDRSAEYTLLPSNKGDKEFKFFFKNFYKKGKSAVKDTTSVGVIR